MGRKRHGWRDEEHEGIVRSLSEAADYEYSAEENKAVRETPEDVPSIKLGKRRIAQADLIKLAGLIVFFAIIAGVCVYVWPTVSQIFEEGGISLLLEKMQQAGPAGVLILLGLQLLQVIVAFIPGEVTQVAAGLFYGPVWGALIILLGVVISSFIVYNLVHALGAPFVRAMVPESFLDKFREFERAGKLNTLVFILFLIPALPKDTLTYIIGLTDMKCSTFLVLSTLGRAPGVFVSAFAASSLVTGDVARGVIIFVIFAAISVVVILFRGRIMARLSRKKDE